MLITRESTDSYASRQAGGKGYNLYLLTNQGFPVPPWIVLGADLFRNFQAGTRIQPALRHRLQQLDDLASTAAAVRQLIVSAPFPIDVEAEARSAFARLGAPCIAVRSSALDEDAPGHSFAGQLSSFLFVDSCEEALRCLKECWASAFSSRCLSYRQHQQLPIDEKIGVAVVFQEMIDCDRSGVLFTCDPVRRDSSRMVVNAVWGAGEGLVSGQLEPDTYRLDKESGRQLDQHLAEKRSKFVRRSGASGTREVPLPAPLQRAPVLTDSQLGILADLGKKVEAFYRYPQDLEWGWQGDQVFLLQARPVTTPCATGQGYLHLWDNANIVESYGGITLPLTFTFARYVYHQVYVQFCELLLVPRHRIRSMDLFLSNMLGSFHGRIYYNLLNWYRLTSILPFFSYNRTFMETMMGTREELSDELAERLLSDDPQSPLAARIRRLTTGLKFLFYHFTIQQTVNRFLAYFHQVYGEFRARDYTHLPADEIYADYRSLERRLLWRWQAPIINDFLCMVHFGILKELTRRWLGHLDSGLQNDLLCGAGNLESAEPTRQLLRLAQLAAREADLQELILSTPDADGLERLNQSSHADFYTRILDYIDCYGFRCMNEMKLEQQNLHQDPSFLFACLKNYLRSGPASQETYSQREKQIRTAAENQVRENLPFLKRQVYYWVLAHTRKAVRNRENTRFCRTRVYGVVRSMFSGMGKDYTRRGIIDRPDDIFYLTLEEIYGSLEGTSTVQDLRALIALRRREYAGYRRIEPATRFATRGPVYWANDHQGTGPQPQPADLPPNGLQGTGCCPGRVEGRVKVIHSPQEDIRLDGEILVAQRTDPGWIPLYPSASGLLVERGGLLSHSAIVAREMGLPTIVGIADLTRRLRTGMTVRMDGQSGTVEILESNAT